MLDKEGLSEMNEYDKHRKELLEEKVRLAKLVLRQRGYAALSLQLVMEIALDAFLEGAITELAEQADAGNLRTKEGI